ncbi:MAG: glycosyltransferase [Solirubrobacterales bacterium]|nr:glycosyltransferase [Solirubrobacterales bacterium]
MAQTRSSFLHPVERLREYLRAIRLLLGQTRDQLQATRIEMAAHMTQLETLASSQLAQLERLSAAAEAANASREAQHGELVAQHGQLLALLEQLTAGAHAATSSHEAQHAQLVEILRMTHDRSQENSVLLRELRASSAYELAYSEERPLVSVVIPTYDNHRLLRERAIPSVLAQTYDNIEIVVVGDAAPEEARAAVEWFRDPRITFHNLPYRGPYPAEPTLWLVAGTPPYNEGVRRASGRWITRLDDDDAFRPEHVERLLDHARKHRLEMAYGLICQHMPDGAVEVLGRFPPGLHQFGTQAALYHAGVARIFEFDLADAAFGVPDDWGQCLRMLRAGVRIGMVESEVVDYYPSLLWGRPGANDNDGARRSPAVADPHPDRTAASQAGGSGRPRDPSAPPGYGPDTYEVIAEAARSAAEVVAPAVYRLVQPRSVVDYGCGTGEWLAAFRECGSEELLGVDGPWIDASQLVIAPGEFRAHDLREPFAVDREFDLALCLEVIGHIPADREQIFLDSLTGLAPVILFSGPAPHQPGVGGGVLNNRWPAYWARHFADRGFVAVDCLRPTIWKDPRVAWWYAQNMWLAVRQEALRQFPLLRREHDAAPPDPSPLVHPGLLELLAQAE